MAETDMEMRLRTALAYKARYDQRPTTDPWVLLMRQQNEDEIARLQQKENTMSEPTIGTIKGSRKDFASMLGEGFHTAFRKATDCPQAPTIWQLIHDMPTGSWNAVIEFVVSGMEYSDFIHFNQPETGIGPNTYK